MSMKYIRKAYKVPAKRGGKILFNGNSGIIVGSKNHYLRVKLDGMKHICSLHPTWDVEYIIEPVNSLDPSPTASSGSSEA